MKLWEVEFTVKCGEHEQDYATLFEADNYDQAERMAHIYCSNFYGDDGQKLIGDSYSFDDGCVRLTMNVLREVDKEEWKEKHYKKAFRIISE